MYLSDLKKNKYIVYVVGGKLNEDISQNVNLIANFFVRNEITVMTSDLDKDSAANCLVDEIIKKGGNSLTVLPFGATMNKNEGIEPVTRCKNERVYDKNDLILGYYQNEVNPNRLYIYFKENMQNVLNSLLDGLMILNCGTEIDPGKTGVEMSTAFLNAILYGSQKKPAKIVVIDDKNCFKKFMETEDVKRFTEISLDNTAYLKYYEKSKDFLDSVNHVSDNSNKNTNNFYRNLT